MRPPVLVTPAASSPVSLADAKAHVRVDHDDEDGLIQTYLDAAVAHLDGWSGVLGRALLTQTWRQDFDRFEHCMRLPLWPISEVQSIVWRNTEGQLVTVPQDDYALKADALGAFVRFVRGYSFPRDLCPSDAVAVTFVAGVDAAEILSPIKSAILLLMAHWYQNREAVSASTVTELPMAVNALIAPYRRVGL